jgi:hypothetical protein
MENEVIDTPTNTLEANESAFLIAEYEQLNSHIQAFWKMRLSIVIASVSLHGYLVKVLMFDDGNLESKKIISVMVLLVATYFISVSIVSTLTRTLWIFSGRMETIGRIFTEGEFWGMLNTIAKSTVVNSSRQPFYFVFMLIGLLVILVLIVTSYTYGWLDNSNRSSGYLWLVFFVLGCSMLFFTHIRFHVSRMQKIHEQVTGDL